MNEYLSIVIGVMLIVQGAMACAGSDTYIKKMKGKYTPESLGKFSKVNGAGSIVAGLLFAYVSLNQLGFVTIGPDFNDSKVVLVVYGIALAILVVLLIYSRVAILKPLDGVSGGKNKNIEDEDY